MWVVYHTAERKIVGLTANTDIDLDKETALAEVVGGLIDRRDLSEYDAIQVTDWDQAAEYMANFPTKLALTDVAGALKVVIREPEVFSLYLTCDAPDKHPVDGIPEIAADGKSYTTITVQKVDERYKIQRGTEHNDLIYLRTDHGIIRNAGGTKDISSVKLKNGEAKFRLVSEPLKRVATVQIMSAKRDLPDTFMRIEFI